jgi:dipeptide/tripeptide permease
MLATLRKFPATFYVANTMEIFERMAWYGMWIPFPLYLTAARSEGGVGLGDVERGVIQGVGTFILYLLPVVTGAFADKFGFKKTFLLAYLTMVPGYFLLGQAKSYATVFFVFLIVAVGAALFKPVVTGTVARVTTSETKAMGFGIFYMMVNVGGFIGPMVAAVVRGWGWTLIFLLSSIWIGVNLLLLLLFYKEPPLARAELEVMRFWERLKRVWIDMTHVLGNSRFFLFVAVLLVLLMLAGGEWIPWTNCGYYAAAWIVLNLLLDAGLRASGRVGGRPEEAKLEPFWTPMRLGDWRFGLYLLIFSGFWTVMNQIFMTLPIYIQDWVDTTPIQNGLRSFFGAIPLAGEKLAALWDRSLGYITEGGEIKPDFLVNVDALCIMLFQILVTWLFARWKPFTTMIVGTSITAVAMAIGVRADYGWMTVLLIVTFSIGEMMASPKSQEYVARIAPADKAAGYMGYYFVSMALGNLFGGLVSGNAYKHLGNPETGIGRPDLMWLSFAGISVLTALLLLLFNRFCAPQEMGEKGAVH